MGEGGRKRGEGGRMEGWRDKKGRKDQGQWDWIWEDRIGKGNDREMDMVGKRMDEMGGVIHRSLTINCMMHPRRIERKMMCRHSSA